MFAKVTYDVQVCWFRPLILRWSCELHAPCRPTAPRTIVTSEESYHRPRISRFNENLNSLTGVMVCGEQGTMRYGWEREFTSPFKRCSMLTCSSPLRLRRKSEIWRLSGGVKDCCKLDFCPGLRIPCTYRYTKSCSFYRSAWPHIIVALYWYEFGPGVGGGGDAPTCHDGAAT
jgi:hypothetical protein